MIRCAAVVCALVVVGCGSDSSPIVDRSSAPPTSTTTSTSTSTTTLPVLSPLGSPQEAATTFVNAWRDGDRATALVIALPAAVDAVFNAGQPRSLENRGCSSPPVDSPVRCAYKTDLGELVVVASPRPDGWIIEQATLSAA